MQRRSKCERQPLRSQLLVRVCVFVCVCTYTYIRTWCFMICGHYWRRWFPWSLLSKMFISICFIFWTVTELLVLCYCRKGRPVNRASQVALRHLQPAGTGTGTHTRSCNSQLALFTIERRGELWPVVTFSQTCLNTARCKLKAISWN